LPQGRLSPPVIGYRDPGHAMSTTRVGHADHPVRRSAGGIPANLR
jgi:hypothetical protein